MAGIRSYKQDGTEGTATVTLMYKEGKKRQTLTYYGCIVQNDENLQSFIQNDINQSADRKKFKNTQYFFYTCDPDFNERRIHIKISVTYHRFSKPNKPKSCDLSCLPDNFVRVQEHIFLLCDSEKLDKCKFLKEHSKKIRVAQKMNTKEEIIYGLSCEEGEKDEEDCLRFIPLKFKLNHKSSNVCGIDAGYHKNYKTLEDAGPVLLKDGKTVVGSFEKKENYEISISTFGNNQDIEREDCSSGSGSGEVESVQVAEERSHLEELDRPADKKLEAKLKEEKSTSPQLIYSHSEVEVVKLDEGKTMEENKDTSQTSSLPELVVVAGDRKNNSMLHKEPENLSEEVVSGDQKFYQDNESEDKKLEEDKNTPDIKLPLEKKGSQPEEININVKHEMSKEGQEHDEFPKLHPEQGPCLELDRTDFQNGFHTENHTPHCYEKFGNQEINEGYVQPMTKNDYTLESHDQQKTEINENKKLLTIPLEHDRPSSNYEEKLPSPIQVSCSGSDDCYSPLEEIKKTLKDGSNQMNDDLSRKENIKKYRRFLLHVAQNATGKCREIGEMLDITNSKLQSLKVDYKSEGNAEQTYQMLVHWRQSDSKPTLEKLLVALIGTELVEVAQKVSDMLTDSRSRNGKSVTEKLLNKITNDVKDVWKFLGRYLGIDESDITSIKMDNCDDTREQARQMFVKWMQSNGRRATTGVLINALRDVEKLNVITTVQVWELVQP